MNQRLLLVLVVLEGVQVSWLSGAWHHQVYLLVFIFYLVDERAPLQSFSALLSFFTRILVWYGCLESEIILYWGLNIGSLYLLFLTLSNPPPHLIPIREQPRHRMRSNHPPQLLLLPLQNSRRQRRILIRRFLDKFDFVQISHGLMIVSIIGESRPKHLLD